MKGLNETLPFHRFTNSWLINQFTFGHGVIIYYL